MNAPHWLARTGSGLLIALALAAVAQAQPPQPPPVLTVDVSGPGGVAAGQTATFTSSVNGGTPPYTYQWYKNGTAPANLIAGATGPTYTTPVLTLADNDSTYFVRITDASGIVTTSTGEALTVFVVVEPQTITFTAPVNPVVSPTPIALNATASSGLPVTFTVVSGPASVSGINLTLSGVGNVTVRATQPGNTNFDPAPAVERTFAVSKGTPQITWNLPATVADGTTLGPAQLNATANVPGTFNYNPASGTVVHTGVQVMRATFTPANTVNYNSATITRFLTVTNIARLTNVSVRTTMAAGQTLIVGFTMQGGEKPVLLRAVGPGLAQLPVDGAMENPSMALYRDTTLLDTNDDWGGGAALSNAFAGLGAFPLPPASLDAALLRPVDGGRTAQITGGAGIVVVEMYDAGTGDSPRLTNVSARNFAGTGSDILIAGFTIGGSGERNLLIRGVGPTLTALNVPAPLLANPKIEVFRGSVKIAENDTWDAALAGTFSGVGAFPLNAGSNDAALTIKLPAEGYTVQVSGADGGTGEALVEIYELP